ncbi:MAG: IclR family transcriptional regulator [Opitutales bacterium]
MAIAVIEKTFQVLEVMARRGEPMPLVRLSAEAVLPKPTAYRILQSLAALGYVAQEEKTGYYFATDRLAGLAAKDPHLALKERAVPVMDRLHARFNETVNLGVLEGATISYLMVKETTQSLRWVVRPGRSDPYYCTALGRAIAAFMPPDRLEALLKKTRPKLNGDSATMDRGRLREILAETRRRGWASEEGETAAGVSCLAIPLMDFGAADAAISLSIPVGRVTTKLRARIVAEFRRLMAGNPVGKASCVSGDLEARTTL